MRKFGSKTGRNIVCGAVRGTIKNAQHGRRSLRDQSPNHPGLRHQPSGSPLALLKLTRRAMGDMARRGAGGETGV
jgi:hypothetical protein